jgi:hypothetical protein
MRRVWPVLLLSFLLLPAPQARAQAIVGFASVPWGASRADIEEAWGRPSRAAGEGSYTTLRYYAQDFAGPKPIRGWNMIFGMRNDRMLSGTYVGLFEREPIAEEARRRMVDEVHSRYSLHPARPCPKPHSEARYCELYVNSAAGDPAMEQVSGTWRTVMIWVDQEAGEWALRTEYMTAAEKAASFSVEDRRY